MNKITLLDQVTIDKIAAGEVVERPSSIVKELVENAIDAGATAITVEIKNGGISLIRITDNGAGIEKDQVPVAFLRHATSKIRTLEDLFKTASLGFRGEALSSISAVSQVELITKTPDALTGTRYIIEGGIEKELEEIGAPSGTTILVRNLFYNTPARAKFLKSPMTEGGYIGSLMEQLSMSHPQISFKFIQNGQTRLTTSGNGNFKEVIYQVYGRDVIRDLIEIEESSEDISIRGYIGKPSISRGNRAFENYYVNGRYVKNRIVTKAIEDAYRSFMMQHKFPFTALFIECKPEKVDVNVHPAKMEVRFQDAESIYKGIYRVINDKLMGKELIPEVSFEPRKKEKPVEQIREKMPEPFETVRRETQTEPPVIPVPAQSATTVYKTPEISVPHLVREHTDYKMEELVKPSVQMSMFDDKKMLDRNSRSLHKVIGQVFDTYWMVQMEDKLYIIDQHAAHERVLYETLLSNMKKQEIYSQYLAIPIVISLNLRQLELVRAHQDMFTQFGFEMEPFGGKEYTIRAVPHELYSIADEQILIELIDSLEQDTPAKMTLQIFAERLAVMACKAAVKGNQKLSVSEVHSLIDQLLKLENPYHCPHGRPTIISITRYELEKKFKRIVS